MEIKDFVEKIKSDCEKNGVKTLILDETHVPYLNTDMKVNGYFSDYPDKVLACATKKPVEDWITILAHESSHMDQSVENSDVWKKLVDSRIGTKDVYDFIDEWINGKEFTQNQLDTFFKIAINTELDCEKRTVEKLKKYELPVNIEEYIQNANAYVYFYLIIQKYRKWYIAGKEPYRIKEITSEMPTNFNNDYNILPENLEKLYVKYCF